MAKVNLRDIPTNAPEDFDKDDTKIKLDQYTEQLAELQNLLYAENKHSVLVILQGMDASGKDGVVKKVFSAVNPMGCRVYPFKKPTEEEASHDFLWRIHAKAPEKRMIHIFNRSHYEDVLVQRVELGIGMEKVKRRFDYINNFERLLQENNTHILKFYLHISKEEQLERFKERLEIPSKKWKYNPSDLTTTKYWDEYMKAYEDVIEHCSPEIPWHIIPSDQNWYKEYLVAEKIVSLLSGLNMQYPKLDLKQEK